MQPTGDHDAQKSDAPARVVASPSTNPGFYVNGVRANTSPQNNRTLFRGVPDGVLGMAYMSLAFFLVAASDAQVKVLTETFHPMQIAWTRQMGLLLGAVILLATKGTEILRSSNVPLQVIRGVLALLTATFFVFGLRFVPLADAVAVCFVAPIMVTAMGALFLGEPVGIRRWSAVIVGFIGTLIIIRPGFGTFHPAMLMVVLAATCFAVRQVLSRNLVVQDGVATTIAYTAFVSIVVLTVPLPFFWTTPGTLNQILLMIGVAGFAALAELLFVKALEVGMTVVVAPVQYTLIIWSTFYGWIIFGHFPDMWTVLGTVVIVATGFYIFNRERLLMRS